jgi:hypothetical protein
MKNLLSEALPILVVGFILGALGLDWWQIVVGQMTFAIAETIGDAVSARIAR